MELTKEELIKINKTLYDSDGKIINESNLTFDLDMAKQETKNIYRSNAHLARGIIAGHPFLEGNKRTATIIIVDRFTEHKLYCNNPDQLTKQIFKIAQNNYTIGEIEKRLRRCFKK